MHFLDYIFIIIFAYGFITGYRTGFLAQLIGFLVLIIMYFFSGIITQLIQSQLLESQVITEKSSPILAFIISIAFLFSAIKITFFIVEKLLKATMLNFFNRILGGIFGVLKFATFLTFIIYILEKTNAIFSFLNTEKLNSVLYQFFKNIGFTIAETFMK